MFGGPKLAWSRGGLTNEEYMYVAEAMDVKLSQAEAEGNKFRIAAIKSAWNKIERNFVGP